MKIRTNKNLTCGVLFLIVSVVLYLLVPIQIATKETSAVNAQTMPKATIAVIFVCSIILIIQGIMSEKKTYTIERALIKSEKVKSELRTVCFMIMLLIYALILDKVGFLIASILLVTGVLAYYGSRKWYFYLIGYGNVALAYFVFKVLLHVNLP